MFATFNQTAAILVLGSFLFCPAVRAAGNSRNPYRRIIERNLFRLKPAPVPQSAAPPTPVPKIKLTGITTILGDKRALLKIQFPAVPPAAAREESCILKEGQSDGPVKVLEIDVKSASVKVDNSGSPAVVTFTKDEPSHSTPASQPTVPRTQLPRRFIRGRAP
jgi:hypothetical protein